MECKLFAEIETPVLKDESVSVRAKELVGKNNFGTFYCYPKENSHVRWLVELNKLEEFISIVGLKDVNIGEKDVNILSVFCPALKERLALKTEAKGKGSLTITETPAYYTLVEWVNGEEKSHEVSRFNVEKAEEVLKTYTVGDEIEPSKFAEKVARLVGIESCFNFDKSIFYWKSFFGDRKLYMGVYYFPLKVLCAKGKAVHRKDGIITRVV